MKSKQWRDIAEIIGILSIVAGLLLVAWEVRQANEIARAQTVMELAAQYNEFNSARFENPDVALLSLKLLEPDRYEISDTDASMMAGAAWHFGNILWSAQNAYDSGILTMDDLRTYRNHLSWMLEYMPGLAQEFQMMYETSAGLHGVYVFEPLAERISAMNANAAGDG